MKSRLAVSMLLLVAAVFALGWLWDFWTPRCNEACPQSAVAAIYSLFIVFTIVTLCIASYALIGKLRLSKAIGLFSLSVFAVSILTALISKSLAN